MTATMPTPTHESKTSISDVLKAAKDADVTFVRLWFNDILGNVKSFEIPVGELEHAMKNGMGFDGSSITGFNRIEESDMVAMPDPDTFSVMPWDVADGRKVGRMICDVLVPGTLKNASTSKRPENSSAPKPFPVRNPFLGSFPLDFIFPRAVHAPVTYHPRESLSGKFSPRTPCCFRSSDMCMYSPLMLTGPSVQASSRRN